MAEAAEESNEGSGSADANETYEGDEAEVTPTFITLSDNDQVAFQLFASR